MVDAAWLDFEELLVPILGGPNLRVPVSPFVMRNANPLGSRSLSIVLVSPFLRNRVLGVRVNARAKHGDHERDSLSRKASELADAMLLPITNFRGSQRKVLTLLPGPSGRAIAGVH